MTARDAQAGAWIAGWRVRAALGLESVVAPAIVFVPTGYLLGPTKLNVLSETVQAHLGPVVSAALVMLGMFVGLASDRIGRDDGRPLAAAVLEASVTMVVVGTTVAWLAVRWALPGVGDVRLFGAIVGLCAAASSTIVMRRRFDDTEGLIVRIADLDDLVVIVVGGVLIAERGDLVTTAGVAVEAIAVAAVIAGAGWLLFESASSTAERGVFVIGSVLLLAGGAAYLELSPLFVGAVAGAVWTRVPGGAAEIIRTDLKTIQHPLVVVVLLVAGASVHASALVMWLLVPLLIFRAAGKVVGGWAAARVVPSLCAADLGIRLLPCGTVGIALALNFDQLTATAVGPAVVSAVALAAVVFEALALVESGTGAP